MDSSSWSAYGKMDAELEAMLPHMPPGKSLGDFGDVATLRAEMNKQMMEMQSRIFPDLTGVEKEEIQIPVRDGSAIRALHYRPEKGEGGAIAVFFHGGGWVLGMPEMHEKHVEYVTKVLGVVVVSVDYRKAPEHVFPTAAHDAIDSVKWVAQNASKLGADPSKGFIVGGASAGGNLAAVAAHQVVEDKMSPPLTGVYLSIPCLIHPDALPDEFKPHYMSWEQNKDAIILDKKAMEFFFETYKPDPNSPLFSPLLWPSGHKTQPPTLFQICGMDPLRDDALIYEYQLREKNGVKTKVDIYPGLPHGAPDFMPMLSASKKSVGDFQEGFQWLLSQS